MQRISSNMTLVYKIFIPTFWFIFMGILTAFILFADPDTAPFFSTITAKAIYVSCVLFFGLLIYFTMMQLVRLEMGEDGFYISNYFKTYRYQYDDIDHIKVTKIIFFNILRIKMKNNTSLGKRFSILYKKVYWEDFLSENPKKLTHLIG